MFTLAAIHSVERENRTFVIPQLPVSFSSLVSLINLNYNKQSFELHETSPPLS